MFLMLLLVIKNSHMNMLKTSLLISSFMLGVIQDHQC